MPVSAVPAIACGHEHHWGDTLGVFDLETTGIDVETCRIVSAHVGVHRRRRRGARAQRLARRPRRRDPGAATRSARHHHRARPRRGPAGRRRSSAEIVAALARPVRARASPVVAYNAAYDLTLLDREAVRYGIAPLLGPGPVIDPLVHRQGRRPLPQGQAHARGGRRVLRRDARPTRTTPAPMRSPPVASRRRSPAASPPSSRPSTVAELHARQVGWAAGAGRELPGVHASRNARTRVHRPRGAWPVPLTLAAMPAEHDERADRPKPTALRA